MGNVHTTLELNPNVIPEHLKKYFRPKRKYGSWIMRNLIVWHKPSCMPSSVKDRFTVDFETIGFFTKQKKYYFEQQLEDLADITQERLKSGKWESDKDSKYKYGEHPMSSDSFNKAIKAMEEKGKRNKRCVWKINTKPFADAHFAVYPPELIETPIQAGCPKEICKKCGKAREKIYEEKEKGIYDEEGNPEGKNRGKMKWNNSHPSKNPRFWSNAKEKGYTDCGCNAGFES